MQERAKTHATLRIGFCEVSRILDWISTQHVIHWCSSLLKQCNVGDSGIVSVIMYLKETPTVKNTVS